MINFYDSLSEYFVQLRMNTALLKKISLQTPWVEGEF